MKLTLSLPDDLYEHYLKKHCRGNPAKLPSLALSILQRFKEVREEDRVLIVMPEDRGRLEALLPANPGPSIPSASDLVRRVEMLASMQIGEVKIPFTPNQLEELKRRAERNGKSLQEYSEDTAMRIGSLFFDGAAN